MEKKGEYLADRGLLPLFSAISFYQQEYCITTGSSFSRRLSRTVEVAALLRIWEWNGDRR